MKPPPHAHWVPSLEPMVEALAPDGCWTKNRGDFTPKMDGENHGKSLLKWMIWGKNPYFWKHPGTNKGFFFGYGPRAPGFQWPPCLGSGIPNLTFTWNHCYREGATSKFHARNATHVFFPVRNQAFGGGGGFPAPPERFLGEVLGVLAILCSQKKSNWNCVLGTHTQFTVFDGRPATKIWGCLDRVTSDVMWRILLHPRKLTAGGPQNDGPWKRWLRL